MTCEAFILNWNEDLLHLTIKHYQQFCDKITVFDNYSTDGSDEVARKMGCKVVKFGVPGVLSDAAYLKIKNYCWKQSIADWVIIVDADEILYHHDIKQVLQNEKERGTTIIKTQGVNVYSEEMPVNSFLDVQTGILDDNYSKACIFDPKRIENINYSYGAHQCKAKGFISEGNERIFLLHYRCVGGPDRIIQRHKLYRSRMSDDNKRLGLGIHYTWEAERRKREWYEHYRDCVEFSKLGIKCSSDQTPSSAKE